VLSKDVKAVQTDTVYIYAQPQMTTRSCVHEDLLEAMDPGSDEIATDAAQVRLNHQAHREGADIPVLTAHTTKLKACLQRQSLMPCAF
jgi:hypothetical protein